MRARAWFTWLMLAACAGTTARADFLTKLYPYYGPVHDVYELYVTNDGANGTGTRAYSDDVTLFQADPNSGFEQHGLVIKQAVIPVNGAADLTGLSLYQENGDDPAALFSGHSDRTFVNLLGDEAMADPTLYDVTLTDPPNLLHNYNLTVYLFEQAGYVPGGVDASAAANGGRGALLAVAVVQHGDGVIGGARSRDSRAGRRSSHSTVPSPAAPPWPRWASAACWLAGDALADGLLLRRRRAERRPGIPAETSPHRCPADNEPMIDALRGAYASTGRDRLNGVRDASLL